MLSRAILRTVLDENSSVLTADAAADQRFRAGVSSSLDVLDAQRELFTAEQNLVQTRLLRLTNAVDVYRGNVYSAATAAETGALEGIRTIVQWKKDEIARLKN